MPGAGGGETSNDGPGKRPAASAPEPADDDLQRGELMAGARRERDGGVQAKNPSAEAAQTDQDATLDTTDLDLTTHDIDFATIDGARPRRN